MNSLKKMQPVFISKYGWDVERGDHGELTVLDKKYKYDVNLEEDGTFVIWWRMSVAKAFCLQGIIYLQKCNRSNGNYRL